MKQYQYTVYKTDGTKEVLAPCKKKEFKGKGGLYELLDCQTIELIPEDYYAHQDWGKCTLYVDEEGGFVEGCRVNPYFKELAPGYNIVGNVVKEERARNDNI